MAPARSSANRARREREHQAQHVPQPQNISPPVDEQNPSDELFLDPLMGTPLAIYVEKDVDNRDEIVELVVVSHAPTCGLACDALFRVIIQAGEPVQGLGLNGAACRIIARRGLAAFHACPLRVSHTDLVETWWYRLPKLQWRVIYSRWASRSCMCHGRTRALAC